MKNLLIITCPIFCLLLLGCSSTGSSSGKQHVYFDKLIEEDQVELVLYENISNAKKRIYLKNFPRLSTRHTKNSPNIFVKEIIKKKRSGVDVKILHDGRRSLYPLSKTLLPHNIEMEQYPSEYNYGVVSEGTQYAIIDDKIIVISEKEDAPRYVEFIVDKKDISEDFKYSWEYAQNLKKRL